METNVNNSEWLNNFFEKNTNPEIKDRLSDLKVFWIDPELFAQFEKRVNDILSQNPWTEHIISNELQKTQIAFEQLEDYSRRRIKWVIDNILDGLN